MPKFQFHMGVTLRSYGNVELVADSIEAALPMLTADYIGEHIDITETTKDSGQDLAIIRASNADTDEDLEEYDGHHLPSPYDPPSFHPDHASDTVDALTQAESFISGFEDDETQEGVADMLAGLRAAIVREQAAPALLAALKQIVKVSRLEPLANIYGSHIIPNEAKASGHADAWDAALWAADAAIAKAEGRANG